LVVLDARAASTILVPTTSRPDTVEHLTAREREVLQLVAQGMPNKSIARELAISEHTVKFHVNAILSKFGAQSRTEAVVLASRAGLVLL
jgi:DNA-binding NarL/FixJ family response regulator